MNDSRAKVLVLIDGAWATQAIAAGCEIGLFDALAAGPLDAEALAAAAKADRDAMERLAKALCTLDLCTRRPDRTFALTAEGEFLRAGCAGSLHGWARMAGSRTWSNWASLAECVRTGRSAREMRGHQGFTDLEGDHGAARIFNEAMVDLTRPIAERAAECLDWTGVRTLVDVGGGTGALAVGILHRHTQMQGVVTDLDHARQSAEACIASNGLASRCRYVAGDFFTSVPASGDVYLLKSVLHNWPDAQAAAILHACRQAAGRAARVVLFERVEGSRPGTDEDAQDLARSDLNMLVGCGGRERTEAQFRTLLQGAGFKSVAITPLTSRIQAIEGRA